MQRVLLRLTFLAACLVLSCQATTRTKCTFEPDDKTPERLVCTFDFNLQTHDFSVQRYDLVDDVTPDAVLECIWPEKGPQKYKCSVDSGYTFDTDSITNKVVLGIKIGNKEVEGIYMCQVVPPTKHDEGNETCIYKHDGNNRADNNEIGNNRADNNGIDNATLSICIIVLIVLIISIFSGVFIYRRRKRKRSRNERHEGPSGEEISAAIEGDSQCACCFNRSKKNGPVERDKNSTPKGIEDQTTTILLESKPRETEISAAIEGDSQCACCFNRSKKNGPVERDKNSTPKENGDQEQDTNV